MATSVGSLLETLRGIVGRDGVRDDPAALTSAAVDGLAPRAVARPRTVEEVAAVLAVANDERLAVSPRGSGHALELGHALRRLDLVLDLQALDRVLEWNPDDLTVSVQAGVRLGTLNAMLRARRQLLPVDPAGGDARTVGGVAATNASGPLRARYGTLRDLLLGVRFVQADGVTTWGGARVVKSVTGYDVPKLMVGALGTLGVLGELTLRLHAAPESERAWLVTTPSLERLQACLDALVASPLQPSRVEVLDTGALAGLGAGDAKAALVVTFGSVTDAVREQGERLTDLGRSQGAAVTERPMEVLDDTARVAGGRSGDTVLEIATLPGQIAAAVRAVARALDGPGGDTRYVVTGRATLGALVVVVQNGAPARLAAAIAVLRETVGDVGGSVVVSRGPLELRAAIDPWGPIDAGALALMRRIKAEFDPRGVLNPGRFVGGL